MSVATKKMPAHKAGRTNGDAGSVKAEGAVYTPLKLAKFVARELLEAAVLPSSGPVLLLDPAVGDGVLLDALLSELSPELRDRCVVHGYDKDPRALELAERRLSEKYAVKHNFICADFLQSDGEYLYDLIIANPPYVRTQTLGAVEAKSLARKYGLSGRVDLYYAFVLEISCVLAPAGTAALITSNRFLTTKSGEPVRRALLEKFKVRHVYDLGDTKLFEAAVLPAVTIAQGIGSARAEPLFSSIYSVANSESAAADCPLTALREPDGRIVRVGDTNFRVRHGALDIGSGGASVWRVATSSGDEWLATVLANTWGTFRDIGKIRVGVKSTADKVFIRSDWNLPGGEPELLMPLLTRHCARRYRALVPANPKHQKRILYPHTVKDGKRAPVDIDVYPAARNYLEQYREQLEGRDYVIAAGRQWYEIWVPQDPAGWKFPKIVFPDISEKPTFWIDLDGAVVNGECYFLRSEDDSDPDLLWLALAVANSTFIEEFYDHRFNNKLYAGRRRWITQYVENFPLPDPSKPLSQQIIAETKRLYQLVPRDEARLVAGELDRMVARSFGLLTE